MSALTPAERSLRARLAAHAMHGAGRTNVGPATDAFRSRFEREAIAEAIARGEPPLAPDEITRRAGHLLRAHMSRLSLAASRARARKAGASEPVR